MIAAAPGGMLASMTATAAATVWSKIRHVRRACRHLLSTKKKKKERTALHAGLGASARRTGRESSECDENGNEADGARSSVGGATTTTSKAESDLRRILDGASRSVLDRQKRELTMDQRIRRAAYRDVTSLKTYPIQEHAFRALDELEKSHLGEEKDGGKATTDNAEDNDNVEGAEKENDGGQIRRTAAPQKKQPSPPQPPGELLTDSSATSVEETKIRRTDCGGGRGGGGSRTAAPNSSPGKSSLRAKYRAEFLCERSIRPAPPPPPVVATDKAKKTKNCDEVTNVDEDGSEDVAADGGGITDGGDDNDNRDSGRAVAMAPSAPSPSEFLPALWSMEPRIFAVEKSAAGKRKYIVGHLGRFIDHYFRKVEPWNRHYYELIPEGTPCRLYFDLEYSKQTNPDISLEVSEDLMKEFIDEICFQFDTLYDISLDRSCVVDLDSSTGKKFSRHLIVHLPSNELFANAGAAGSFVKILVGRLAEQIATGTLSKRRPALSKHLFVNAPPPKKVADDASQSTLSQPVSSTQSQPLLTLTCESTGLTPPSSQGETEDSNHDGKIATDPVRNVNASAKSQSQTCFVDLGVYTRNRLFRLLGSSKFGKPSSAALRFSDLNAFPFPLANEKFYVPSMPCSQTQSDKDVVGSQEPESRAYTSASESDTDLERFRSSMDWNAHAEALALTLVVPMNASKTKPPILPDPNEISGGSIKTYMNGKDCTLSETGGSEELRSKPFAQRRVNTNRMSSMGPSPFPPLDEFVVNVLGRRGGTQGAIRAWSIDAPPQNASQSARSRKVPVSITYQMSRNRWCEFIGRSHRSNNIMWTCDLQGLFFWQSCHDPECRAGGFRGKPVDLPDDIRQSVQDALFEQELSLLDENVVVVNAAEETCPSEELSVDDADFEKALLALDISGAERYARKGKDEKLGRDDDKQTEACKKQCGDQKAQDQHPEDDWDDALNQALFSNPELFP